MLQRIFIQFSLIFLFAFTQMGVVTHEISHFNEPIKQSSSDKKTTAEQCGKCIAYAQSANAVPTQDFFLHQNDAHFQLATIHVARLTARLISPYCARAPPFSSLS